MNVIEAKWKTDASSHTSHFIVLGCLAVWHRTIFAAYSLILHFNHTQTEMLSAFACTGLASTIRFVSVTLFGRLYFTFLPTSGIRLEAFHRTVHWRPGLCYFTLISLSAAGGSTSFGDIFVTVRQEGHPGVCFHSFTNVLSIVLLIIMPRFAFVLSYLLSHSCLLSGGFKSTECTPTHMPCALHYSFLRGQKISKTPQER